MKHLLRTIALAFAYLVMSAGAANAGLFNYSLSVLDNGSASFAGNGTISFNTLAGSGTATPAFEAFAFSVTSLDGAPAGQMPLSFNAGMISSLQWAINASTLALTLDLDVTTQTSGNKKWDLSFDTIPSFSTSVTCNSVSNSPATALACYAQNSNQEDVGSSLVITNLGSGNPGPSVVPEPGSLALLGAALGAFGLSRRRKLKSA